ncbi:MAG: M6 family metalloprotease domain-containing protein, partial [Candidatus Cloacimonetes bacterium]|nr:M6 family metalloprotease domain-containing protein [Candidatus Cloacimonadota bacterium]MCK9242456.1 M6 family metalloprotease domain-containing protein [Candidatus Cloacimonadota bacterium]
MKVRKFIQVSLMIISLLAGYQWLVAAYLTDMPVQVNQPDGTMINCFASGDEYHNWLHDEDGYTIIQSPDTGYYTYAIQTGDTVSASDLIVGLNDPQLAGLNPKINISEGEYQLRRESAFPEQETRSAPTTGTINNIVIFIRFSDQTEFVEDISLYDGWFNSNASSLKNYFLEASYSQLTVNTTLYPAAVNNLIVSWQDSHPRAYYSPYNAITNPIGYNSESARSSRELTLLQNATNSVSSQIPSDLNIDSDSDGKVDNIVYVVRGGTDSWNSLLWPHKWSFYDRNVYIHGKKVEDFNFQLQNYLNDKNVGVLCHEFFHTLGAPDLYHYDLDYLNPVGIWDLMAVTINPPIHMGAYMKWKYGGWISTIPVISTHQAYTIHPLTSPSNNAYKIISPNSDSEYFIVEYRKKSGTYETRLEGSGLLIYRINTDAGNGNSDGPPDEVYIYRPGGTLNQDGNYLLAHYSSEEGRTEMNAMTDPSPFLSNDDARGLEISEIGTAGDTIGFRLGPPPAHISGTVFLEDSQEHVCDVVVELIHPNDIYDEDAYAYQTTHPDANGAYQFEVPNGQHRVRYRLFDLESGLSYYPYISPVMTMGPDTPDFHITVPQYTLKNMTISQLMVSSNEDDRVFSSFSEAIKHAKVIIASPFYAQNVVNINISGGDYYWPWTAPSHGDITVSCNNPNVVKSIVIRGNTSDITSISPRYIEELDIQATNIALQFSNIHFNQAAGETNDCTYTIHTADNGSIKFYNCCFGFREYENQTQYRTHRFVNSSNIEFDNCKFIACRANRGDFGILKFDNCNDVRIVHTEFHKCVAQFGGAIHITSCEGVNVSNCTFDSNHSLDNNVGSISDGTEGGAIFVYDSQNLFFNDNRFIHNEACGGGGPLYLRNCSTFSIVGNEFIENYNDHLGLDTEGSYSVGFQTCHFDDTKPFERNIIKSFETISSHFLLIGSACTGNLVIQNCVFDLDNASEEYNCILFSYSPVNALFDNCVFDSGTEVARFVAPTNSTITVCNSLFSNVPQGVTSLLNSHCNIDNMGLDEDYRPIWNTVMKSPCIDAGNPDLNANGIPWYLDPEDQDSDGTRMDVGAYHNPAQHINGYHRLNNYEVKYISIPGVENHPGNQGRNTLQYVFGEYGGNNLFEAVDNRILDRITWIYNSDGSEATPSVVPLHYVHSQNGYKVKLLFGETLEKD